MLARVAIAQCMQRWPATETGTGQYTYGMHAPVSTANTMLQDCQKFALKVVSCSLSSRTTAFTKLAGALKFQPGLAMHLMQMLRN